VFYELQSLKGWGVDVDNAGKLRFNSQWSKAAGFLYFEKVCLKKEDPQSSASKNYIERIEKSKKTVFKAIEDLRYGKDGSKAISSVSERRALTLFNEIEGGYKELFNLIDNLVKTCDERLLGKIDEVSENTLSKAMELTSLLDKESAKETRLLQIVITILILTLMALNFGFFIYSTRILKNTISELTNGIKSFEKGDFRFLITTKYKEFSPIANSLNALKRVIEGMLNGMLNASEITSKVIEGQYEDIEKASPVSSQIQSLVEKASSIGGELSDLLASIERSTEEMKLAISEISKNTHETADRAKLVKISASEMEETVLALERSMGEIRNISEIIRGIAEQTNLLALNASIEAARAGEAGKGFAVVANEVKELAKKVSDFTGEIEKIVDNLSQEVKNTVEKAEKTKEMVDEVEKATSMIAGAVEEQTAVTTSIVENTHQTREKSFALISEIEDLRKVVEKLNELFKDIKVSSDILSEISLTNKITGKLFDIEKIQVTDEELEKLSVNALVNLAVLGHINWKMGFISALNKGVIPQVERDHRRCLLGRSMHILEKRLKGTPVEPVLKSIERPHEELHGLVGRVERELDLKDKAKIKEFIELNVLPTFEEVMKHLLDIRDACRRHGCD
jgi:methyl-accepting chemotaxis protein